MIDGGLFNPTRTVDEFSFAELDAAVAEHGAAALNALADEIAQQPGIKIYRVDDVLNGPRLAIIRDRLVPTITTVAELPRRPWNVGSTLIDLGRMEMRMPFNVRPAAPIWTIPNF